MIIPHESHREYRTGQCGVVVRTGVPDPPPVATKMAAVLSFTKLGCRFLMETLLRCHKSPFPSPPSFVSKNKTFVNVEGLDFLNNFLVWHFVQFHFSLSLKKNPAVSSFFLPLSSGSNRALPKVNSLQ